MLINVDELFLFLIYSRGFVPSGPNNAQYFQQIKFKMNFKK